MNSARVSFLTLTLSLVVLPCSSCFFDTDKEPADVDTDSSTDTNGAPDGGGETGNVSGTVTVDEGLDEGSYAVADLYLAFLAECPTGLEEVESFGVFVEESLDFSVPGATRVFAVNGAPSGLSYLSVFLDSNGTVDNPEQPEPDNPDAVSTTCAEIDLPAGDTLTGVAITLDMTMPSF